MEGTSRAHNEKYFNRWCYLLEHSFFRHYYRYIANKYEPRFAKYGYSLTKGLGGSERALNQAGKICALLGPVYCLGADMSAFLWRSAVWSKWHIKQRVKALLPEFVLNRIREARQTAASSKERAEVSS